MKYTAIILGLFALSSILSCRVQTSPSESATADVIGQAMLDSNEIFLPNSSGITVSLEGTNYSTVTDDSGRFELKNVPSGTYTVRWSKPGYGDIRYIGATIQGGGNTPVYIAYNGNITRLRAFSHLTANLQNAYFAPNNSNTANYLVLEGTYTDDEFNALYSEDITAFFSHKQDVSPIEGNYDGYGSEAGFVNSLDASGKYLLDTVNQTFQYTIGLSSLTSFNFQSGDSIYVATYGSPYDAQLASDYGDYFDPINNEYVMTCYNQTPSRVIGLRIP
jgi:predicted heme/steroid binding protein